MVLSDASASTNYKSYNNKTTNLTNKNYKSYNNYSKPRKTGESYPQHSATMLVNLFSVSQRILISKNLARPLTLLDATVPGALTFFRLTREDNEIA